jgi:hypothetical protein
MTNKQMYSAPIIALLLCSCAAEPPVAEKVPVFERIAIVTLEDIPELSLSDSESEVIERSVYGGAAAGTVGGAAIGAAACGPVLYGPCVAIMSWLGLVAGSTGGAAIGLYNYSGLSETDAAYVADVLARIDAEIDFHIGLSDQLTRQIPPQLISPLEDAEVQAVIGVSGVNFLEIKNELVRTELYGTLILTWIEGAEEQAYTRLYKAEAPLKDIDELIADDGILLEVLIEQCLNEIAAEMGSTIIALSAYRRDAP